MTTNSNTNSINTAPTTTPSGGDHVAGSVGDKVRGVFGAVHGAGEAIRGTINSGLDGVGDGVAGRQTGSVQDRQGGTSSNVAQSGLQEIKQSIGLVKGENTTTGGVSTSDSAHTVHTGI